VTLGLIAISSGLVGPILAALGTSARDAAGRDRGPGTGKAD
jgi:hypothetical protein